MNDAWALLQAQSAPILVAFSGGGDSTALLHMLRDELPAERLIAGIVDHGVRAGSADEAKLAARRSEAIGVPAYVLTLAGVRRSQAAWRRARYAALCDLARSAKAEIIAVAHTRDDQAETVLMRMRRTNDARLLAGMAEIAPAPLWPEGRGLRVARPLLSRGRKELRDWRRARGTEWIEDPSNENTAFERIRARRALDDARARELADQAKRLRVQADALDRAAAEWINAHVRLAGGKAMLACDAVPHEAAARALSALIAAIAGADSEPEAIRVARLREAAATPSFRGATLGGARIKPLADRLEVSRDPGGLLGRGKAKAQAWLALPAGEAFVWDGRLQLESSNSGWSVVAAAVPPERTAPVFSFQGQYFTLEDAHNRGVASEWLLNAHLRHLLPLVHPALSGAC